MSRSFLLGSSQSLMCKINFTMARRTKSTKKPFGIWFSDAFLETKWYISRYSRKRAFLKMLREDSKFYKMWEAGRVHFVNLTPKPVMEEWYDKDLIMNEIYPLIKENVE